MLDKEIAQKEECVVAIINVRNKLIEFMDESNMLLKILDPQSIRETIKELRWEIRTIKLNQDISEVEVIEYQEKMYDTNQTRSVEAYEKNVPF